MPHPLSCPLRHGDVTPAPARRAVFLDRDGVLIEDTGYPDDPETIRLLPGVGEALRTLREAGWALVVVSNQSGVARGKFTLERLREIHDRLRELVAAQGVFLDALYFCPHHPQGTSPGFATDCDHRKPEPGMLRSAAVEMGLQLSDCWMIGDKESDVAAGHAAGCRSALIGAGPTDAEITAPSLALAVSALLRGV
jgi:D-glycero-D-manno-heptose 1,7-bisphosphate phosphatase